MKSYLAQVTGSRLIGRENNIQAFAGFYLAINADEARGLAVKGFNVAMPGPGYSIDAMTVTDYTENVLWAAAKLLSELKT